MHEVNTLLGASPCEGTPGREEAPARRTGNAVTELRPIGTAMGPLWDFRVTALRQASPLSLRAGHLCLSIARVIEPRVATVIGPPGTPVGGLISVSV